MIGRLPEWAVGLLFSSPTIFPWGYPKVFFENLRKMVNVVISNGHRRNSRRLIISGHKFCGFIQTQMNHVFAW